jgi:Rrf2 family nitric oxide-sensitive transcriptional repressor
MMKLNRKLEYALMALKYMHAKPSGQVTAANEIAKSFNIPFDVTSRALQIMTSGGLLKSGYGAAGGYQIIKNLDDVNLYELTSLVLGPVEIAKCISESDSCDLSHSCNIKSPVQTLNQKMMEFYKNIPLSEIVGSSKTRTEEQNKSTHLNQRDYQMNSAYQKSTAAKDAT